MKKIITTLVLAFFVSQGFGQSSSISTTTSSNLSISVSSDDDDYSYTARFDGDKTKNLKEIITKTLGKPTEETERTAIWEGKGYSASLRKGKVELEMDFDQVTKSFRLKMEDLGDQISEILGSPKTPEPPKPPRNT